MTNEQSIKLIEQLKNGTVSENNEQINVALDIAIKALEQEPCEDCVSREERDKAIDLLDNLIGMVDDNQNNDYDFALKKGIESLQKEPCEDCVSRQDVKKWLNRWEGYIDKDIIARMECRVIDIPSVKPTSTEIDNVLNDIKAEIRKGKYAVKKGLPERSLIYANGWDDGLKIAIDIIDKYRGNMNEKGNT